MNTRAYCTRGAKSKAMVRAAWKGAYLELEDHIKELELLHGCLDG